MTARTGKIKPGRRLPVAIVQQPPVFLNLERSVARACSLAGEAAREGARLVVFPETWLPGYPVWLDEAPGAALWDHPGAKQLYQLLVENSLNIPGVEMEMLLEAVRKNRIWLTMGAHERRGGSLYNVMLHCNPEGEYFLHRKLMPTYGERLIWGQGDGSTLPVVQTPFGNLGGLICWEHWMPLARAAMHARQETVHVAQWPAVGEVHQLASRHYAFEGQCFVLAAGTTLLRGDVLTGLATLDGDSGAGRELLQGIPGPEERCLQRGGSAIIAPDSHYVAGPVFDQACILYGELELELVTRGRLALDTSGHYARPDVFRLQVDDTPRIGVVFQSEK